MHGGASSLHFALQPIDQDITLVAAYNNKLLDIDQDTAPAVEYTAECLPIDQDIIKHRAVSCCIDQDSALLHEHTAVRPQIDQDIALAAAHIAIQIEPDLDPGRATPPLKPIQGSESPPSHIPREEWPDTVIDIPDLPDDRLIITLRRQSKALKKLSSSARAVPSPMVGRIKRKEWPQHPETPGKWFRASQYQSSAPVRERTPSPPAKSRPCKQAKTLPAPG